MRLNAEKSAGMSLMPMRRPNLAPEVEEAEALLLNISRQPVQITLVANREAPMEFRFHAPGRGVRWSLSSHPLIADDEISVVVALPEGR